MLRRPADDPPGSVFVPSITYSSTAGEIGQMALYTRRDTTERAPVVVFVHGGGWSTGHHYGEIRYLHPLAARGYVAATLTYRFLNEGPWPASIEDTKCAVRWLRHHAAELGADPDRIVICGGSAGGQLSALTALTPGRYEGDGGWHDVSSQVQGAVLISPAVDLEAMAPRADRELVDYFGDDLAGGSPINHITPNAPPILTLTGSADTVTTVADITRFHAALEAAGVTQRLEIFDGRGHGFDLLRPDFERCLTLITDFVADTVGLPSEASHDAAATGSTR
jgi:acetyl esterase/lipase